MTTLPVANRFTDGTLTNAQAKAAQNDLLAAMREMLGGEAVTTLTIAAGVIVPTRAVHLVDTESSAAADDLDRISNVNHPDGRIIILGTVDQARDVTVKHGLATSGNNLRILLAGAADLVLSDPSMRLVLQRRGTDWVEIDRVYGTQTSAARAQLRVGGPWTDVATAATVDLGAQASTNLRFTGTTAVTSLGATAQVGETYTILAGGAFTLTHNASSLICPGGASIAVAVGDIVQVSLTASGVWRVTEYQRADGRALVGGAALTTSYKSSQQTMTAGATITLAHGLGAGPEIVQLQLVCVTADGNYTAGQTVFVGAGPNSISGISGQGFSTMVDGTNVTVTVGASGVAITNRSGGAALTITLANWRLVVFAAR